MTLPGDGGLGRLCLACSKQKGSNTFVMVFQEPKLNASPIALHLLLKYSWAGSVFLLTVRKEMCFS